MSIFAKLAALAVIAALLSAAALAENAYPAGGDETDWLIARRDGQWELVSKGATGRVHKMYPNQEVLRRGPGDVDVLVVSMPPLAGGGETTCSQKARRDARDPCSSSFLACRRDPGGSVIGVPMLLFGATESATDRRNRWACAADMDAILQAASDVGMIARVPPVPMPLSPNSQTGTTPGQDFWPQTP